MDKLVNFSIETDNIVLLQFKNGQERRVSVIELGKYLASKDLAQVTSALQLRRDFLRTHMPKLGLVFALLMSSLFALLSGAPGRVAAQVLQQASRIEPAIAHDQQAKHPLPVDQSAPTVVTETPQKTSLTVAVNQAPSRRWLSVSAAHANKPAVPTVRVSSRQMLNIITRPKPPIATRVTPMPAADQISPRPSPSPTPSSTPFPSPAISQSPAVTPSASLPDTTPGSAGSDPSPTNQ